MSDQTDDAFIPPVDRVLARSTSVLSWRLVQKQLSTAQTSQSIADLQDFLTNEQNLKTLTRALCPFDKPTQASRQDFETRTAPIHVSSSGKDVEWLKKDALWLTTQLDIDEISSLRIALLEWQSRSPDRVLGILVPSKDGDSAPADVVRHERLLRTYLQEKTAIREVAALLVGIDAGNKALTSRFGHEPWLDSASQFLRATRTNKDSSFLKQCLTDMADLISQLEDTKSWPTCYQVDFGLHEAYATALLQNLASNLQQAISQAFQTTSVTSTEDVLAWFRLMQKTTFLQIFNAASPGQEFYLHIVQALVAILSVAILKLPECLAELVKIGEELSGRPVLNSTEKSYIHEDSCVRELNLLMFEAVTANIVIASPAMYAWSIITMTIRDFARVEQEEIRMIEDERETTGRHGSVSRRPSAIELKYDALQDAQLQQARDDPPQSLARFAADDLKVYDVITTLSRVLTDDFDMPLQEPLAKTCRSILFDLVGESLAIVPYEEHVIEATLALLSPSKSSTTASNESLVAKFLKDHTRFRPYVLEQALSRYPYELTPLLQLLDAASVVAFDNHTHDADALDLTTNMPTMTITLPENFRGYILEHEEEGANAFRLVEDLPLFLSNTAGRLMAAGNIQDTQMITYGETSSAQMIPRGTQGVILRDSRPFIVQMRHQHNGLHYLSLLLETFLDRAVNTVAPPAASVDTSTCIEIIDLFTALLSRHKSRSDTNTFLNTLAEALPTGLDAIGIIADVLDLELLSFPEHPGRHKSTELAVSCINFLTSLHNHFPERIWSVLSQSSLLADSSEMSLLSAIASSAQDGFLVLATSLAKLYQIVLDDAVRGLVQRKKSAEQSSRSRRFDSPLDDVVETSERTISTVLLSYTRLAIDILQQIQVSIRSGNQVASRANQHLLKGFHQLLTVVFGVAGGAVSSTGFAVALKPAADFLLASLSNADHTMVLVLSAVEASSELHLAYLTASRNAALCAQASAAIQLLIVLVRLSETKGQSKQLAALLTGNVSYLAILYAAQDTLRKDIVELMSAIIAALTNDDETVSLFSKMQPHAGQNFLQLLTELDQPMRDTNTECALWSLFSAACEYGQQWFAMYLLTGILPRDRIRQKDTNTAQIVLSKALDALSDLKSLAPERALAITIFVSKAQKLWVWATALIRSHTDFLDGTLTWLRELKPVSRSISPADALLAAREYAVAAALCDILAVGIHAGTETGDKSLIKRLLPSLGFLAEYASRVDGYNKVLHSKLQQNIAGKFSGLDITDFKRTLINPASIGREYLYDTTIARQALSHNESWLGTGKKGTSGYEEEFARANINWSLVDASKELLDKWQTLAVTLANSGDLSAELLAVLVTSINSSLSASLEAETASPDIANILQTRADLVFSLLSRLGGAAVDYQQSKAILERAWTLVITSPISFDVAEATDDLTYYRSMLRILLLSLNTLNRSAELAKGAATNGALVKMDFEIRNMLVEIVTRTVSTGFRALCANLHGNMSLATPDDFALLTALMQSILANDAAKHVSSLLADAVIFSGVARSALSLYSWSDNLADATDHEPVYGELAALFLATISRIPQVAEHLALEGCLTQLSSAGISDYLRRPKGKTPFDRPNSMFTIWTDAFLPLCINMLEAVGAAVAGEVSSFVNSFPEQLKRAEKALVNASPSPHNPQAGAVTLGLLSEARDLILLDQVLKAAIQIGAAEGIDVAAIEELNYDATSVAQDVEALVRGQRSLRDRTTPANAREAALYGDKNVSGRDNALEVAMAREIKQIQALVAE